jgi:hypothetical protein
VWLMILEPELKALRGTRGCCAGAELAAAMQEGSSMIV